MPYEKKITSHGIKTIPTVPTFEEIASATGRLVTEKNKAYGSSYQASGVFLKLLFPNGVPVDRYEDLGLLFRMFDKMMRIANRKDAFGESPYQDLEGYSILGQYKDAMAALEKRRTRRPRYEITGPDSMALLTLPKPQGTGR